MQPIDVTRLDLDSFEGRPVAVLNDADAAGVAEMRFGAGRGRKGVILMITLGTGIGSALFVDGTLVPNTELGHIPMHSGAAEDWARAQGCVELASDAAVDNLTSAAAH